MPPPISADLRPCADGSAVRTALMAFLFFFETDYMDSPDCLLLLLSISVF